MGATGRVLGRTCLTPTHPTNPGQKRNGMMEPDDFRACLISMGYDLVSPPAVSHLHTWPAAPPQLHGAIQAQQGLSNTNPPSLSLQQCSYILETSPHREIRVNHPPRPLPGSRQICT